MSTIASQIKRIQDATNSLRDTGANLKLYTVDVADSLRIDNIAEAFAGITLQTDKHDNPVEIPIEIKTTTDGYTLLEYPNTLPAGYYSSPINLVATLKDDTDTPYVLNIQQKAADIGITTSTNYIPVSGDGTVATPYTCKITPNEGYNYMSEVNVTLPTASFVIPPAETEAFWRPIEYTSNAPIASVTFTLNKEGWINSNYKAVLHVSKQSWTRNSQAVTNVNDVIDEASKLVKVNSRYRTVLTLDRGLLPNGLQLTIPSLEDITNVQEEENAATEGDVIKDKQFYVNGQLLTGTMDDYRVSGSTASSYSDYLNNSTLSFQIPAGAYSADSIIATNIAYDPSIETSYVVLDESSHSLSLNSQSGTIKIKSGYYSSDVELTTSAPDSEFGGGTWNSDHTVSFTCNKAGWVDQGDELTYHIQHSTLEYELNQTPSTTDTDDLDVPKDGFWEFTPDPGTYYSHVKISPKNIITLLESI